MNPQSPIRVAGPPGGVPEIRGGVRRASLARAQHEWELRGVRARPSFLAEVVHPVEHEIAIEVNLAVRVSNERERILIIVAADLGARRALEDPLEERRP